MQKIIKLNRTMFDDIKAYGAMFVLESLSSFMKERISVGNQIQIELRYTNSEPDFIELLKNIDQVDNFINRYK